jgi:ankyrin repeat protein
MLPLILVTWLVFQEQPKLPEPPKALIEAAEKGEVAKLHELSQHPAFSNPDKEGRTALVAAGEKGQKAAFAELIAIANASVKTQFAGLPRQGQPGVAPALNVMAARMALFRTPDKNGRTPLMLAASHGWDELIQPLLEGGANNANVDKDGRAAADYAAAAGFTGLAEKLRSAAK